MPNWLRDRRSQAVSAHPIAKTKYAPTFPELRHIRNLSRVRYVGAVEIRGAGTGGSWIAGDRPTRPRETQMSTKAEAPISSMLAAVEAVQSNERSVAKPIGKRIEALLSENEVAFHELASNLLDALPIAVYTADLAGRITFYNRAAADLWGHNPELGKGEWCGSWRLYWPDGRPLPHDQCPMAVALKERRAIRGAEA